MRMTHKKLDNSKISIPIHVLAEIDGVYVFYVKNEDVPFNLEFEFALLYAKEEQGVSHTWAEYLDKEYRVIRRYFNISKNIKIGEEGVEYIDLERDVVEEDGNIIYLDSYPKEFYKEVEREEKKIVKNIRKGYYEEFHKKTKKVIEALVKTILITRGVSSITEEIKAKRNS